MKVIDPGHKYELLRLDGDGVEIDTYVKRIGNNYPGNIPPAYPGTIIQEKLRGIVDRLGYVNGQIPCAETEAARYLIESAIVLLEIRAKRVKGKTLDAESVARVVQATVCHKCGHVFCGEHDQPQAAE